MKTLKMNTEYYEIAHIIRHAPLYIAVNKDTPEYLIENYQQSLEQLMKRNRSELSEYEKILRKHLKPDVINSTRMDHAIMNSKQPTKIKP